MRTHAENAGRASGLWSKHCFMRATTACPSGVRATPSVSGGALRASIGLFFLSHTARMIWATSEPDQGRPPVRISQITTPKEYLRLQYVE